jgi:hypothetical protein
MRYIFVCGARPKPDVCCARDQTESDSGAGCQRASLSSFLKIIKISLILARIEKKLRHQPITVAMLME